MSWILYSLASAGFASMSFVLAKQALKKEHAYEFLITALGLHVIFSFPSLWNTTWQYHPYLYILILKGILVGLAGYIGLRSFRHLEISEAVPLKNLESLFVLILAISFLGENINFINIGGIILLLTGTYFLERSSHKTKSMYDFSFLKNKFVILAFLSVVFFSLGAIIDKLIVPVLGYQVVWVFGHLFAVIVMAALFKLQHRSFMSIIPKLKKNSGIIVGGAITSAVSAFFYFSAVAIPGALIAIIIPIRQLSSLFTVLISGKVLHDHKIGKKSFACILMILGFIMILL